MAINADDIELVRVNLELVFQAIPRIRQNADEETYQSILAEVVDMLGFYTRTRTTDARDAFISVCVDLSLLYP